ncbi:hypothetical protein CRM22_009523 [Opisthorchis felineus]|uniref:Rootletin-like coiled-coil domain-containing protein n=1 Tax=Opisthorchis felineus TaxID=147828 RepID=A0A4S2L7A9_OPIFE|nr:hypothetical protein CRM22_009523 [Opisthorchis felineus]TGZ58652.1 hypothetical protein CRM22_009523 [Opisthorchis felineus]
MDEHGKQIEEVLKEGLSTQTTNPSDEISLDRFFHLAGVEPSQLEAIYSGDFGDVTGAGGAYSGPSKPDSSSIPLSSQYQMGTDQRSKADEEAASYRRKLAAYQDGQQKQAQLIQKLQTKVLQYKKRVSDLELEVEQLKSELETSDKVVSKL